MKLLSRLSILMITTLACAGLDQSTKMLAHEHLQGHASLSFFYRTINFVYAENTGTMLGIGSGLPESLRFLFFVVVIGIALIVVSAFVLLKPLNNLTVIAISLVIGGGISNLIDRLLRSGSVIDFMLIKIGPVESGIFNVADIAITLGTCVLFFEIFRARKSKSLKLQD
jgi:signal peptidase II